MPTPLSGLDFYVVGSFCGSFSYSCITSARWHITQLPLMNGSIVDVCIGPPGSGCAWPDVNSYLLDNPDTFQ